MWSTETEKVPTASLKISSGLDSSTEADLDGRAEIHVLKLYTLHLRLKHNSYIKIISFKNSWPYRMITKQNKINYLYPDPWYFIEIQE
jgi:hypothetical protein